MLLPVLRIRTNQFANKNNYINIVKSNGTTLPPFDNFKSIYSSNSINFTHYMGFENNKDITVDPKYFKLPQIELNDGTIHQFTPDKSQIECAKKLLEGDSVLYCAPTGTGKTAVAHFAVNKNLDKNKRTIITVPLIALANDKYREFSKLYGTKNVGIMTGDRKVNTKAPIVIMTTEILYNQSQNLKENQKNIGTVVFDETHYLSDKDRGTVWENSIMACIPNDIQILCLSATIGNSNEFADWIQSLNNEQNASLVEIKPKERYVPLVWQIYNPESKEKFNPVIEYSIDIEKLSSDNLDDKQKRAIARMYQIQNEKNEFYEPSIDEINTIISSLKNKLLPYYQATDYFEEDFLKAYPEFHPDEAKEISNLLRNEDDKYIKQIYVKSEPHDNFEALIQDLKDANMLPALIFKLSKAQCDNIVKDLYDQNIDLTNNNEKKQIKEIINEYSSNGYLGNDINEDSIMRGYASHHSGKLPQYRKLVEELFSKKLLKVVSATSTLSSGINMPAKTVVISDMAYRNYNPQTKETEPIPLSVNEFHQMAGRAGRRGIDSIGNVVLYNLKAVPKKFQKEEQSRNRLDELNTAYQYIGSSPDKLRSQYRPEAIILARYYSENSNNSALYNLVNKSFKIYCSKKQDEASESLVKQFENYSHILLKQGFLYRDYKNEYLLTPKGEMLLNSQGANPLMVSSLIYDETLKNISPEALAQIAGYIAGSDDDQDIEGSDILAVNILQQQLSKEKPQQIEAFKQTQKIYKDKEERLLKALKESKVVQNDIISSDNISGYILYLWAYLNNVNSNYIENFEKISSVSIQTNKKELIKMLDAKLNQGNIYRTISHSISALKQIQRICDFALSDSYNYPNSEYYKNLKSTAQKAMELINKEPIRIEDNL